MLQTKTSDWKIINYWILTIGEYCLQLDDILRKDKIQESTCEELLSYPVYQFSWKYYRVAVTNSSLNNLYQYQLLMQLD